MERSRRGGMAGILALGMGLGLGMGALPARGQAYERERDVKVTGPRGRSIERRSPQREGARDDQSPGRGRPAGGDLSARGPGRAPAGLYRPGPPVYAGRPGVIRQREVIIDRRPAIAGGFIAAPFFNFAFGTPAPPPPPVMYYPPPPVYVEPVEPIPPVVVSPPRRVVVDAFADAMTRLQSDHDNSRRDGAYTLGRLGDPRGPGAGPAVEAGRRQGGSRRRRQGARPDRRPDVPRPRCNSPRTTTRSATSGKPRPWRSANCKRHARSSRTGLPRHRPYRPGRRAFLPPCSSNRSKDRASLPRRRPSHTRSLPRRARHRPPHLHSSPPDRGRERATPADPLERARVPRYSLISPEWRAAEGVST